MQRYEDMLKYGLAKRGHQVEVWGPQLYLSGNRAPKAVQKWLRYLDQYLLFPMVFYLKSRKLSKEVLFVLIDQALGIWTPLIKNKKHVVHCHDFIALKSALGLIEHNPISKSGQLYQKLIVKGFRKASNFIAISKHTQNELETFLEKEPKVNAQVYNAIAPIFKQGTLKQARMAMGAQLHRDLAKGYILHVGGNTFYKNREGVIQMYNAWRSWSTACLPLVMIGAAPTTKLLALKENSAYCEDIYFLIQVADAVLIKAYQGAAVFVFPSLYEGFGFPIAEAMACRCPVITTNAAPMNEVGGTAAVYVEKCNESDDFQQWLNKAAMLIEKVVQLSDADREKRIKAGLAQCQLFEEDTVLDQIEKVYQKIQAS